MYMLGVTVTYLLQLKAEGESAGDTDHKLQNIVRLASVGNVFTVSDANGTTYAWGEGSVHGKEISSDEPVSYDEMKVLNLNVVYAQVKENDEVTRAYTMSNPLPTSLELTSNKFFKLQATQFGVVQILNLHLYMTE